MKTLEEADLILQYKKNTFPREGGAGLIQDFSAGRWLVSCDCRINGASPQNAVI